MILDKKSLIAVVLALLATSCCTEPEPQVTELPDAAPSGQYLGQQPPGPEPRIFAPGFISTALSELNSAFAPDGNELLFAVSRGRHFGYTIFSTKLVNGAWSQPETPPFAQGISAVDMSWTADGRRLYYCSGRPQAPGAESGDDYDLWYVEKQADGSWGEPVNPGEPLNSPEDEVYPTSTEDGTLYFQSGRDGGFGGRDIYRARLVDGEFQTPENLGPTINTASNEGDVLVAPDESYIIFNSRTHDQEGGDSGLCISFRTEDDGWTSPRNLGRYIPGHPSDFCPMLSPDGRYLFFSSGRLNLELASADSSYQSLQSNHQGPGGGLGDIYWVDAAIIDKARAEAFAENP